MPMSTAISRSAIPTSSTNPLERLLSKDYAAEIRAKIDAGKAGSFDGCAGRRAAARGHRDDALLDRRQGRQRGRRHLHDQRAISAPG